MNHQQVAHVWANRNKPRGKGANLFFEGGTIYSYGRHFPIASFAKNKAGKECVLFTNDTYSKSTARHCSYTRRALDGLPYEIFYVPKPTETPTEYTIKDAIEDYIRKAKDLVYKARRARTQGPYHMESARDLLHQAERLAKFFKIRKAIPSVDAVLCEKEYKARETQRKNKAVLARAFRQEREARELQYDTERFEKFLAGDPCSYCPSRFKDDPRALPEMQRRDLKEFEKYLNGGYSCPSSYWNDPRFIAEEQRRKLVTFEKWLAGEDVCCPSIYLNDPRYPAEKARREELQRLENAANLEAWKRGELIGLNYMVTQDENGSAYMRVKGDRLETSLGAQVTLPQAIKCFRFVKLCRMTGRTFEANGMRVAVGSFDLRSVSAEGNVRVGCHYLTWERIEEVAKAGNFFNETASDEAVIRRESSLTAK